MREMASHSYSAYIGYGYNNENLSSKCKAISSETQSLRRSANYEPSTWSADFFESLRNDHDQETDDEKAERLKVKVKNMVGDEGLEPSTLLKLIGDIQRLGLGEHFEKDIKNALSRLAANMGTLKLDLNSTALIFRLLRQNGSWMSQGDFEQFIKGNIKGMLNFFETSYLAFEEEHLLDEAKAFRRIQRLEVRDFIETYHSANGNDDLLELAKLDFNKVQAMHQKELQELSMWWRGTGLANRLSFARDRLTECFFCSIGATPKPQFSACRKALTKAYKFLSIIDDVFDIYGYLDELELFTTAIERWNINAIDDLPDYMKSIFLALDNIVTEIGCEILKEKDLDCIPFLKKTWEDLCKAFLVEAKWRYNGQTPTFKDYLNNGWVSSSVGLGLTHAYFYVSPKITLEGLHCLFNNHDLLRLPSTIFRLANDLATFEAELEIGETANAISCYAKQFGVSFDDARKYMGKLIDENWKGLHAFRVANKSPFANDFMEVAINHARLAQCLYQYGDSYGSPDLMKKQVSSLIIEPV